MLAMLRTLEALALYDTSIVPQARAEIRRWAAAAASIPDPMLREHALASDARSAEAVAAFGAFAPCRLRRATVELLVAWQILIDYVDTLGEQAHADPLAHGLQLGTALVATIADQPAPHADDGGYLATLVAVCRNRLRGFPAAAAIEQPAASAAARCAHALAYAHAAAQQGTTVQLRDWATRQAATHDYEWWEVAGAGNSNISVLALLAAAADPATTAREAAEIEAAYWPHVCALSTLLDSLVDHERDAASGDFSFVAQYPDEAAVRRGLVTAARRSLDATATLRRSHTHATIVCGVVAFYATAAEGGLAARVAPSLLDAMRPAITPILLALRAQRRLGRRSAPAPV